MPQILWDIGSLFKGIEAFDMIIMGVRISRITHDGAGAGLTLKYQMNRKAEQRSRTGVLKGYRRTRVSAFGSFGEASRAGYAILTVLLALAVMIFTGTCLWAEDFRVLEGRSVSVLFDPL